MLNFSKFHTFHKFSKHCEPHAEEPIFILVT